MKETMKKLKRMKDLSSRERSQGSRQAEGRVLFCLRKENVEMRKLGSHSYSAPSVVATLSRFHRARRRGPEGLEGVSRPFVEEFRRPLDGGPFSPSVGYVVL
ncbi:unnamed protein product [Sphagnum troendelagicum]